MFFEETYPAIRSRKICISIPEDSGIFSALDKRSGFDRLFPNQDGHSGKGLGNLIALPLQKKAMENGNACFIHPENLNQFPDQWAFLETVQKVKMKTLDELYEAIIDNNLPALLLDQLLQIL